MSDKEDYIPSRSGLQGSRTYSKETLYSEERHFTCRLMHVSTEAGQPHSDMFGVHSLHNCTYVHIVDNSEAVLLIYIMYILNNTGSKCSALFIDC